MRSEPKITFHVARARMIVPLTNHSRHRFLFHTEGAADTAPLKISQLTGLAFQDSAAPLVKQINATKGICSSL